MLRITVNRSSAGAKKYYSENYYSEGHGTQEYYTEKGKLTGLWHGKAAEQLGLKGQINKEDFDNLCDNLIPGTSKNITARIVEERRVGYDFTFNASKSVSLAYTFGSKEEKAEILKAFQKSVQETMAEMEGGVQARIRKGGANENRETGNIAYAEFLHFTSRPVGGLADPHLHAHCFAFNITHDETEKKWKAADFAQINKDAPYYEAVFHSRFAEKLQELGYSIKQSKTGFELAGIERGTIEKFSRRTEEIEKLAKEKDITSVNEKASLGAKTREGKREGLSETAQVKEWNERLNSKEREAIKGLKSVKPTKDIDTGRESSNALQKSIDHHLERKSVATEKEILGTAIKASIGKATIQDVLTSFQRAQTSSAIFTKKKGFESFITSKEALLEENNLILNAYATKGRFKPIHESYEIKNINLNDEQKKAVQHALTTSDGITIIAGKAGTGKTTLMREVQSGIRESGKEIFAFAPSAEASRVVQRSEGFENAETLAALIKSRSLQEKTKNAVIWIDEAGMVSNKQMNAVLSIAKEQNARIILTGDTKQHNSVERGDAQRVLEREAGIVPIEVSRIQRQKNQGYKDAVSALSKTDVEKGFKRLDKIGAIHEIENSQERVSAIANDYVTSSQTKGTKAKDVLVISPTHAEGDRVNKEIREQLRAKEVIGKVDKSFTTLKSLQFTQTEKQTPENYKTGHVVNFHQNIKGFKAGSKYIVTGSKDDMLIVKDSAGKEALLSPQHAKCFNVFEQREMPLTKGDKLRITGNGKSIEGKNLFNGIMYKVTGFDKQGNIKLSNGSTLSKDYGHFSHGYVVTSHASQGKTVDKVIISQNSMSFRASSQEQFYVSVSRGRQAVAIYTDDKKHLIRAISQSNERQTARELTQKARLVDTSIEINRKKFLQNVKEKAIQFMNKINGHGLQGNIAKTISRSR